MAYMLSTVKQMRYSLALEEDWDWQRYLLVCLLALSVLLQLAASALLLTEQNTSGIREHKKYVGSIFIRVLLLCSTYLIFNICRYNVGIQVMAVLVVGINVFTTGFV